MNKKTGCNIGANYTIAECMKGLGIANKKFYEIIDELELPKNQRGLRSKSRRKSTKATETDSVAISAKQVQEPSPVQELIVNGLHLSFNGTYEPDMIVKQLLKFGSLLEGEENKFYVEFKIMERAK